MDSRRDLIFLTDEQVSILDGRVARFRAAKPAARSIIIQDSVKQCERDWTHDADFDQANVETVCTQP
jgi:hypothetical protein